MRYNDRKKSKRSNLKYFLVQDNSFINPYNFVPTPTTGPIQNINVEEVEGNTHKGYFTCQLVTKTPLAIPDVAKKQKGNSDEKNPDKYPFMALGDKPMIPGSSVRGVIRNIYEAATNSCMITVAGDDVITARTSTGEAFEPAILMQEDGEWNLYEADPIRLTVGKEISIKNNVIYGEDNYKWGEKVWLQRGDSNEKGNGKLDVKNLSKDQKQGYVSGYVYIGEPFSGKYAAKVFIKGNFIRAVTKKDIDTLKKTHEIYNDKAVNRNAKKNGWYKGFQNAYDKGVVPLWYKKVDEKLYLSLASIGRKAYYNTLSDIPNVGRACKSRTKVCKACALFGMVGDKNLGSKVRFTDAIVTGEARVKHSVILKELGSPKPSYLSFYTTGGATYDDKGIEVRGRKFYWHNPKAANDPSVYTNKGEDVSRSSEMELLDTGSKFEFKVYYDGITDEQLETLAWALTLGDNDPSSKYCIKIGHGKPIGLGSSKIIITECVERNVDVTNGSYSVTDVSKEDLNKYIESGKNLVSKNIGYNELIQIADFNGAKGLEVRYPYIKDNGNYRKVNDIASHKWFTENKKQGRPLPNINEATMKQNLLHPYELSNGGNFGTPQKEKSSSPKSHSINATANLKIPAKGEEFEMTVTKINKKGNYILGKEGNVTHILYADKVKGNPLEVKDKISVSFSNWKAYDDGNVNYIYNFIRKI